MEHLLARVTAIESLLKGPLASGAIVSLAIRLAGIALLVVQAILTARLLGPEGYGAVAFVIAVANVVAAISLMGALQLTVREVARLKALGDLAGLRGYIRAVVRAVSLAVVLIALGWIAATVILPDEIALLAAVAFIFPIFAMAQLLQEVFRGFGRVVLAQAPYLVVRPLLFVIVLTVVYVSAVPLTPEQYLLGIFAAAAVALFILIVAIHRQMRKLRGSDVDQADYAHLAAEAAPLFVFSMTSLLLLEINTLMLAPLAGEREAGLFQPIIRMASLLILSMTAISARYAPRITEFWATGELARLSDITSKVTIWTTGLTVVSALFLVCAGEMLLGLFGNDFTSGAAALWVICLAQIINVACGPSILLLAMTGHSKAVLPPQLCGLFINVTVGLVLIPAHTVMGAAIAFAAGIVSMNIAALIVARRRLQFDPSIAGALKSWLKK